MRNWVLPVAIVAVLAVWRPAEASILTFTTPLAYGFIPQEYGDNIADTVMDVGGLGAGQYGPGNGYTPHVTVDYGYLSGGTFVFNAPRPWVSGYGDLTDVVYSESGARVIRLTAEAGFQVVFNGLDYAGWAGVDREMGFVLRDAAWQVLDSTGAVTAPGSGHATWSPEAPARSLLYLEIQGEFYYGAVDNVNFDEVVGSDVPEPASIWLLGTALGIVALRFGRSPYQRH